jgi:hypothetical protein
MKFMACSQGPVSCYPTTSGVCNQKKPFICYSGYMLGYSNGCDVGCIVAAGPECGGAQAGCAGLDENSCGSTTGCHAVYEDPGTCDCVPAGCCTRFKSCAAGPAVCTQPQLTCERAAPECDGPYVVSYKNGCYEGCVKAQECAL